MINILICLLCQISPPDTIKEYILSPVSITAPYYKEEETVEKEIFEASDGFFSAISTSSSSDLLVRTPFGIQGDLSIRGANYQQILLLLDGIPINDPQTAHHNQDIPLPSIALERAIILKGKGSGIWAPDAMGGTVFLKTEINFSKRKIKILKGGYSFSGIQGIFGLNSQNKGIWLAGENLHSKGFTENRDFLKNNFALKGRISLRNSVIEIIGGYGNKDYGAENFYAPFSSRENTEYYLSGLKGALLVKNMINSFVIWIKSHRDSFTLEKDNPDLYWNRHNKITCGVRNVVHYKNLFSIGFEYVDENIKSTRLGKHRRKKFSTISGLKLKLTKLNINPSLRVDFIEKQKPCFLPHLYISGLLNKSTEYGISFRKSCRLPSFTELFYYDPKNSGDSLLLPENSLETEVYLKTEIKPFKFEVNGFLRDDRNLISWVKTYQDTLWFWKAKNISKRFLKGIETSMSLKFSFFKLKIGYSRNWYNSEPHDIETKYALRIIRDKISGSLRFGFKRLNILTWGFHRIRFKEKGGGILNMRILYTLFRKPGVNLSLKIFNLLNSHYEDFPQVPYPPRWVQMGIGLEMH